MKKKHAILPVVIVSAIFLAVLLLVPINSNEGLKGGLSIFDYVQGKRPENTQTATILLGGDVMLGRTVMGKSIDVGDYTYPFLKIADFTSQADITFINLENPIFEGCTRDLSGVSLVFCATPEMANGLTHAGIDVVNLANNHSLNYGRDALEQTKGILLGRGISYSGDSHLEVIEVNGTKFGFIGFDKAQLSNPELTETEENLVLHANNEVDVLVVAMHWGVEYEPTARPGVQNLARKLVDLGADVVVGHHPHVIQNIEKYNEVPIYYSLGNLIFDQMGFEERRKGLLIKLTFEEGEIVNEEQIETYMQEWAQPEIK